MTQIEIRDISDDGLTASSWEYNIEQGWSAAAPIRVALVKWQHLTRPTKRHKWQQDGEGYVRRSHNGHHHYGYKIPAANVPEPENMVPRLLADIESRLIITGAVDPEGTRS